MLIKLRNFWTFFSNEKSDCKVTENTDTGY